MWRQYTLGDSVRSLQKMCIAETDLHMTVSVKNTEGYQHEYNTTERDSKSMHLPTTEHKTNVTTSSTCGTDST